MLPRSRREIAAPLRILPFERKVFMGFSFAEMARDEGWASGIQSFF
jgi:hypothetical protein